MVILWFLLALISLPPSFQQSDFLSLSCGASNPFNDSTTGLTFQPDTSFVFGSSGEAGSTSDGSSVRFFPLINSTRNLNCFDINRGAGLHLARATFSYKNYDKLSKPPSFEFIVNQTRVSTINLGSRDPVIEEVIVPGGGAISFCVLATSDAPVIASLELRPVSRSSSTYQVVDGITTGKVFLRKLHRINSGEASRTIRYPDDPEDRIWDVDTSFFPQASTTTSRFNGSINATGSPAAPLEVLRTSRVAPGGILSYVLGVPVEKARYLIVASFAMLSNTTPSTSFDVLINGAVQQQGFVLPGPFAGSTYAFASSVGNSSALNITFRSQASSPEVNALEVYKIVDATPPTTTTDATALSSIAVTYLIQNWNHDPCSPVPFVEIKCSDALQVTSLDLSNKGLRGTLLPYVGDLSELQYLNLSKNQLSGPITPEIWELSALESLDLSFNQLSGNLPNEFHSLDSLKLLNLQNNNLSGVLDSLVMLSGVNSINIANNNFSGQIPKSLEGKIQSSGNICLGRDTSECIQVAATPSPSPPAPTGVQLNNIRSKTQTGKVVGIAVGCSVAALLLLLALFLFSAQRRRHKDTFLSKRISRGDARDWHHCKEFSYKELSVASNKFRNELGKGSFGPVYHGRLSNGQEVAIKVRSDASQLGADAFINEVALLSRVRHQNLVELLGFCQKPKKQLLVYEFMAGGTLMDHLYGSKSPLDWKTRLKVAVGAATGLDYLHNGSDPKIIHRDIKTTNILLDSALTPKVADFGLSKHIATPDATHVTTLVKGTAGYLDPEYYASNQLTEKSDVYSYGVVLLEIICGREVLSDRVPADEYSIINWAKPLLQAGSYNEVADRNILGRFSLGSMAIVADCACKSVSRNPDERPRMSEVLRSLREALAFETNA